MVPAHDIDSQRRVIEDGLQPGRRGAQRLFRLLALGDVFHQADTVFPVAQLGVHDTRPDDLPILAHIALFVLAGGGFTSVKRAQPFYVSVDVVGMGKSLQRDGLQLFRRVAGNPLIGRIGLYQAMVPVHDIDSHRGVIKNGLQPFGRGPQRFLRLLALRDVQERAMEFDWTPSGIKARLATPQHPSPCAIRANHLQVDFVRIAGILQGSLDRLLQSLPALGSIKLRVFGKLRRRLGRIAAGNAIQLLRPGDSLGAWNPAPAADLAGVLRRPQFRGPLRHRRLDGGFLVFQEHGHGVERLRQTAQLIGPIRQSGAGVHFALAESLRGRDQAVDGSHQEEVPEKPRRGHCDQHRDAKSRQVPRQLNVGGMENRRFGDADEDVHVGRRLRVETHPLEGIDIVFPILVLAFEESVVERTV